MSELPVVNGLFDGNHANSDLMTLSPNPNSGKFSISSDIPLSEISIYDFSGRLLAFYNSIPETLNLNYNKGIYFVKAKSGNGYLTKKIVIE